jgi:hypothetical protein
MYSQLPSGAIVNVCSVRAALNHHLHMAVPVQLCPSVMILQQTLLHLVLPVMLQTVKLVSTFPRIVYISWSVMHFLLWPLLCQTCGDCQPMRLDAFIV